MFHSLPSAALHQIMIKYLAMECARKLKLFPPKGVVSKYCSPREILHQQKLDFHKQCSIPQISYVQLYDESYPSNSQAPQSLDFIHLHPLVNVQGEHELLRLATRHMITQQTVMVIPMPTSVIAALIDLATAEGMKGHQTKTKSGLILTDSVWIVMMIKVTLLRFIMKMVTNPS